MNFGVNRNGNNWKMIVANFLILFAVQILWLLYEAIGLQRYPSEWECYEIIIKSLVATVSFYGFNKLQIIKENKDNAE